MAIETFVEERVAAGRTCVATVAFVQSQYVVRVQTDGQPATTCDVLQTSNGPVVSLVAGDAVLIWLDGVRASRGVVLGRIGPSVGPAPPKELPDELLLEAKKGLILRVGEGSITIRADGKILIKGKDLVSHAKRTNRIKGGSVSLN